MVGWTRSVHSALASGPRTHRRSPARLSADAPRSAPASTRRATPPAHRWRPAGRRHSGCWRPKPPLCITESVKSRRKSRAPKAATMPAVMPPTQKASRLSMGLGREIRSAVIPIRTGSIAASRDSAITALHSRHLVRRKLLCERRNSFQRRRSWVLDDISTVSLMRWSVSVPLATIGVGGQHYSLRQRRITSAPVCGPARFTK